MPLYNEEARLRKTASTIIGFCTEYGAELVLVDDGSADKTQLVMAKCAKLYPNTTLLSLPHQGKGHAVAKGILKAKGDARLMCDVDLATPLDMYPRLSALLSDQTPIVIGSRRTSDAMIKQAQPWLRRSVGYLGRSLVSHLLQIGVSDTQCGFKLYRHDIVWLFEHITTYGAGFDFELLAMAHANGIGIDEVGIEWVNDDDSRFPMSAYFRALKDLFGLAWRVHTKQLVKERPSR